MHLPMTSKDPTWPRSKEGWVGPTLGHAKELTGTERREWAPGLESRAGVDVSPSQDQGPLLLPPSQGLCHFQILSKWCRAGAEAI